MKKLPIGIQSFESIREENYYYVDKTPFVKKLVDEGKYYFLARPRRFGKSLFLDTLRQAFLGKRELFQGLYLENNWDWNKKYPVIYISFGAGVHKNVEELKETFESFLIDWKNEFQIQYEKKSIKDRFLEAIQKIYKKFNQKVVILVDEYDKPILDNITRKDVAIEIREELKNFYSVIKDADPYLKFCFITGVTKFSKVSLFSGLNNLKDITLDPKYATICGYTQQEFEKVFAERLNDVDLEKVKKWYNGYNWLGENVYNPFDILLYLDLKKFRPFWFETGTLIFLINLLIENKYFIPQIENLEAGENIIGSFDVEQIDPETLLFQTGYLTIDSATELETRTVYHLRYPNLEVKMSFNDYILAYFAESYSKKEKNLINLYKILSANELHKLKDLFSAFFASIPHDWYRKTELAKYEGFYASIFYCYFTATGFDVIAEDTTSHGRIDMTVFFKDRCYIFEFKVVELEGKARAIEQLKAKKYYEKYQAKYSEIYLIGVEFSKNERNIIGFEIEKV